MLPDNWHRHIFLFGLIALGGGMLFGAVPMSVAQTILLANWLLEKNYSEKWHKLKNNTVFWVIAGFFFLHIIGLIYSENLNRGLEDIKIKLPLIVLPIILFSSKPLSRTELRRVFDFFCLSVFLSSVWCYIVFLGYTKKTVIDARQASVFMSHIRFSLCIAFAIFNLIVFSVKHNIILKRIVALLMIAWLLFFMYKLEMATGIVCLSVVCVIFGFIYLFRFLNKTLSVVFLVIVVLGSCFLIKEAKESLNMFDENPILSTNLIQYKTINGRLFSHDPVYHVAENGNLIGINICKQELLSEWEKRSQLPLNGNDKKGSNLYYTLLRYMSSKGLTKDSIGLLKLSSEDIKYIENGISNYKYINEGGFTSKWRELIWEYNQYKLNGNPSGHSLSMRLEFWKTAVYIISKDPIIGIGTGDVQDVFNKAYVDTQSKLDTNWRLRSHNQYLAITVAFGIVGLLVFLLYLLYPVFYLKTELHNLFWPFYIICLISFFTEDTLETQAGVTFFSFFFSLFLWLAYNKKMSPDSSSDMIS